MSTQDRREREIQEMQQLILKTAVELFVEEGIDNVSLRKIADKIDYSPGSIYSYFKDKGEIILAIHTEGFNKLYEMQRSLDNISDPLERLSKMGEVYMKFALENPDYYDLMFIAKSVGEKICEEDKGWEAGQRSYEYLRNTVKQCVDEGYFIDTDVDSAAFAFWGVVHGMASLIIRGRCAMIPPEQINNIVQGSLKVCL